MCPYNGSNKTYIEDALNKPFPDYIRRLFASDFGLGRVKGKFRGCEVVIAGEELWKIYSSYQEKQVYIPSVMKIFVFEKESKNITTELAPVKVRRKTKIQNFIVFEVKTDGDNLKSLAKQQGASHFQLCYCFSENKFFKSPSFIEFENTGQLSVDSSRGLADSKIKHFKKCLKTKESYFNLNIETNILSFMASFKGQHGSVVMGFIMGDTDRCDRFTCELDEINRKIGLYKFSSEVRENFDYVEFLLRVYYQGGGALINRVKKLSRCPMLFKFFFERCQGTVELAKEIYPQDVRDCELNYLEKNFDQIAFGFYLETAKANFTEIVQDLYMLKRFTTKYQYFVMRTIERHCIRHKGERITWSSLCKTLSSLIEEGSFDNLHRPLNNPIDLKNFDSSNESNLRVVELRSKYELMKTGALMRNCLGMEQYAQEISFGRSRIFQLQLNDELATVEFEVCNYSYCIREVKGRFNSEAPPRLTNCVRSLQHYLNSSDILSHGAVKTGESE